MSLDPRCPQCAFVSRQLGQPTPCLLHVSLAPEANLTAAAEENKPETYDEPYEFGRVRPTADRPGPFTLREYTRLLLLRGRVLEARAATPESAPAR